MSDAFQTMYRDEFIASFEVHQSLLRDLVTTEATIKGNQAVFLVSGSGGATAVTRGVNGEIPARADSNTQTTATLREWHDLVRKTDFNVFASQGNQRAIMQMTTMAVINRKIDEEIYTLLNTGTVTLGSSTTIPNVSLFQNAIVKLANADVSWDSNISFVCQPSFLAYLEQTTEFTNAQYVDVRPYAGDTASWRDKPMAYKWRGTLLLAHPSLPGNGTSSEKSFLFHKASIGHCANTAGIQTPVGYNDEQAYSWARASIDMGGAVLQNSGIINITTDGSQYA